MPSTDRVSKARPASASTSGAAERSCASADVRSSAGSSSTPSSTTRLARRAGSRSVLAVTGADDVTGAAASGSRSRLALAAAGSRGARAAPGRPGPLGGLTPASGRGRPLAGHADGAARVEQVEGVRALQDRPAPGTTSAAVERLASPRPRTGRTAGAACRCRRPRSCRWTARPRTGGRRRRRSTRSFQRIVGHVAHALEVHGDALQAVGDLDRDGFSRFRRPAGSR